MNVQVLVAAMNQSDYSLLHKMNIKSDVIVGNQCDRNSIENIEFNGYKATYLNFAERGVGLNRNNTLIRATGDICLFADDDMVYADNYVEIVIKGFEKYPQADALIFNINTVGEDDQNRRNNSKDKRIRTFNSLNYGATRIAVKRASILKKRICFSQLFGGGTMYSSGEDSLFIRDMLKNGFKIYAIPEMLATVDQSTSTWFSGYHEKFFYDKGALMKAMFPKMYFLMNNLYFPYRYKSIAGEKPSNIRKWMNQGSKAFDDLRSYI